MGVCRSVHRVCGFGNLRCGIGHLRLESFSLDYWIDDVFIQKTITQKKIGYSLSSKRSDKPSMRNIVIRVDYFASGIMEDKGYTSIEAVLSSSAGRQQEQQQHEQLCAEFKAWTKAFTSTLDQSYPPDSGFINIQEAEAHTNKGYALQEKLQDVLGPDVVVDYDPIDAAKYVKK